MVKIKMCYLAFLLLLAPAFVQSQSLSALQKRAAKLEKGMRTVTAATNALAEQTDSLEEQTDDLEDEVDELQRTLIQIIRGDTEDGTGTGTSWTGENNIFGNSGFRTEALTVSFVPSNQDANSGTFVTSPHLFWRGDGDVSKTWTGSYTVIGDMIYFFKIPPPDGGTFWSGVAQGDLDLDTGSLILVGKNGPHQIARFQLSNTN